MLQYALLHKFHAGIIAAVEINGTYKSLERIAVDEIVVMGFHLVRHHYQLVDTHLTCQFAKCVTCHKFAACVGEKSFTLARKMLVDNVTYYSIEHSIPKKLKALIVHRLSFLVAAAHALVHQGCLVKVDVARIKARDAVKSGKKLLFLSEREPYFVYDVTLIQHTS